VDRGKKVAPVRSTPRPLAARVSDLGAGAGACSGGCASRRVQFSVHGLGVSRSSSDLASLSMSGGPCSFFCSWPQTAQAAASPGCIPCACSRRSRTNGSAFGPRGASAVPVRGSIWCGVSRCSHSRRMSRSGGSRPAMRCLPLPHVGCNPRRRRERLGLFLSPWSPWHSAAMMGPIRAGLSPSSRRRRWQRRRRCGFP
jgi:hypothetical protein